MDGDMALYVGTDDRGLEIEGGSSPTIAAEASPWSRQCREDGGRDDREATCEVP